MPLSGKAHKFGDDISTDLHVFDKHGIFRRKPGEDVIGKMAATMLTKLDPLFQNRLQPGDFIVAGHHFGTLSMYDQAAAIILRAGVAAVLAVSFNDLFTRHAVNRGLLLITCDTREIQTGDQLSVDLDARTVMIPAKGHSISCSVPHTRVREWLASGGVIEYVRAHGDL